MAESDQIAIADATLADAAVLRNPFPFYRLLREHDPVHYDPTLNAWLVSRYADVRTVLLDAEAFSMERGWSTNYAHGFVEEFMAILERDGGGFFPDVIMTDPPRHTRVRKLMEQAFTAHRVKSLEAGITQRVVRFIDGLPDAGEIDGIHDLAMPLTIDILAEQLGIPRDRQPHIERWTLALSAQVGRMQDREEMRRNAADICEMQRYIIAMIEQRRHAPTADLVSDLVHARNPDDDQPVLDFAELVACTRALIGGGSETTANGIAGLLLMLATRPAAARRLHEGLDDSRTVNRFVEEALRLSPPPRAQSRLTTRDVELGGTPNPADSQVLIMFATANHDPRQFPEPEAFDLERPNLIGHLTFGAGIHRCVGLSLARMEMAVVAREVSRRLAIRLAVPAEDIVYLPSTSNHSMQRLPLAYAKRGTA
jgi:cytochrome P450